MKLPKANNYYIVKIKEDGSAIIVRRHSPVFLFYVLGCLVVLSTLLHPISLLLVPLFRRPR